MSIYSINKFSSLKIPTDQIYSYPVYDQMSSIVIPSFIPKEAFKPYFLATVLDESDHAERTVLSQNSFSKNWTTTGKAFLHQGDKEDLGPYLSSTDTKAGPDEAGVEV